MSEPEIETFRTFLIESIRTAETKDLARVFGYDTFDLKRQIAHTRDHIILLLQGDETSLLSSLRRFEGEDKVAEDLIKVERQMTKYGETLEEAGALLLRLVSDVPRDSIVDARATLVRLLDEAHLAVVPWKRKTVRRFVDILDEALKQRTE